MHAMNMEPVAITALVRAGLLMLVSFGFDLTPQQIAATMLFAEAALVVITRNKVSPVDSSGELRRPPSGEGKP